MNAGCGCHEWKGWSRRSLAGDDATYTRLEQRIDSLTERRDSLASKIRTALNNVEFEGQDLNQGQALGWIIQATVILVEAARLE